MLTKAAGHLPAAMAGGLTAYLAFNAGGFFLEATNIAALALALALLLRLTLANAPVAGWGPAAAGVAGALACLACWTLLSWSWSAAPGRALVEFDRTLLYLLAFALFATLPRREGSLASLLRWVLLAIAVAAAAGLATRLFPGAFAIDGGRIPARLGFPLTYWNAMSVLCALGAVLALHAASGRQEPALVRIAATAALPVLVVAGYFPFSRGGIATAIIGLVAYVMLARPRRLPFALLAGAPPVALALAAAYGAEALATAEYAAGAGPDEGRRVALALGAAVMLAVLLRTALLPLERRLDRISVPAWTRRRLIGGAAVAAVCSVAVVAVTADGPQRVEAQLRAFGDGNVVSDEGDLRERLAAAGNNGRVAFWRVALDAAKAEPLHGTGAGTYQLLWERDRDFYYQAVDGHSLYLETLAELGVVGLALLALALGGILFVLARGVRGPDRHAHAAALAAGVALMIHAGVDWDWEMPVLFVWLAAAGGLAAARRPGAQPPAGPARLWRVVAGLGCLLLAATPALLLTSESAFDRSTRAFDRGDCRTAVDAALDSRDALSARAEPFEVLGYCNLRGGAPELAVRAMAGARERDPDNWRYAYGLAVAQAIAGEDPRSAAADAVELNPLEPIAGGLHRDLQRARPARWPRVAAAAPVPPR